MVNVTKSRLLIVEDEKNLGLTLMAHLKREGYEVAWAKSFEEAHLEISQRKFDLTLLDVGLPDGSGFDLAQVLRKNHSATAIIFLTAFNSPNDRIKGLELGAEDYVVKPFHLKELLLRIQNGLKRARYLENSATILNEPFSLGKAQVYFSKFEIYTDGKPQSLSHKECALLKFLVERRGKVVSRDEILNHIWEENTFPSPRTVDNFILQLRKWVECDTENPQVIKSIRGVGYQLL